MLEKLLESIDSNILTAETKAELEQMFNESVELKATEIANTEIAEKQKILEKSYNENLNTITKKIVRNLDKYVNESIKDVVAEIKSSLNGELAVKRAETLAEAFDVSLLATGVNVGRIQSEISDKSYQSKLKDLEKKYSSLSKKYKDLTESSETMIQYGTITELKEGLSLVEQKKFEELAKLIKFEQTSDYFDKLKSLRESVKGVADDVRVEKKEINESAKPSLDSSSWKRLI